ncbi:MAG: HIT domain-containing protein [Verrucomicrobiota bacterium]|nr:MAG: HIT domain-containing protein [Verrucomicrobiota bacterium]
MNYLHAYWRVLYIDTPQKSKGNPFLEILNNPDERTSLLLFRTSLSFVVLNRYPYNAGHLLVLPQREIGELSALSPEEQTDFFQTIIRSEQMLQKALTPDGINIGMNLGHAAGAGIPQHLHCHLVPRWDGDTNFMPVIADTKVLPIALEHMWEKLRTFL